MLEGYAWEIVINDIDPLIYAFWWSILNDKEAFLNKIETTLVNMRTWRKQKMILDNPENYSLTDVGFSTFFLNRTNRSGILKGAEEFIKILAPSLTQKCLIYFDPPYFKKGKLLYSNYYTSADHEQMASLIRSIPFSWIVTYDNDSTIRQLYAGEAYEEFDVSYSAHIERPRGAEILFYKNLVLPSSPYTRKCDVASPP